MTRRRYDDRVVRGTGKPYGRSCTELTDRSVLEELKSLDTGRRALRNFGLVVGTVFLLIGAVVAWRTASPWSPVPAALLGTGSLLVVMGSLAPGALYGPYLAWMALAVALGYVMTRVLLTVVYVAIVTPIGLVMRIVGRDPMHRRPDPSVDTYWIPKEEPEDVRDSLTRYW